MIERQGALFPDSNPDEEELEAIISPLYPSLWKMIREPFDDLAERRAVDHRFRVLDEGETAQWLRPQIAEEARVLFDGSTDVAVQKRSQQFYLDCFGKIAIIPKKLKPRWKQRGLTYASYPTQQNRDLYNQKQRDGLPELPRLIVGYQFIKEMTEIRIWVAFPHGRTLRPCFLMPDQTGAVLGVFRPAPDIAAEDQDKGWVVRPKRKDSEEVN